MKNREKETEKYTMELLNNSIDLLKAIENLKLYRQSRVVRWQLRDFMFSENDSEHQLYVTQIIIFLASVFNISDSDTLVALKYGAIHDYVESCSGVGDVNFGVKRDNPKLKELVEQLEDSAMKTVPEFYDVLTECRSNKVAKTLVDLADAIDAVIYVRREVLYNKNCDEWYILQDETQARVEELFNELKELL